MGSIRGGEGRWADAATAALVSCAQDHEDAGRQLIAATIENRSMARCTLEPWKVRLACMRVWLVCASCDRDRLIHVSVPRRASAYGTSRLACRRWSRICPPHYTLGPSGRGLLPTTGCGVVSYQNAYHFLPTPFRCIHNRTAHSSAFLITFTCITYMMHSKNVAFVHLHFRRQSAFVEHVFILHSRRCI